jgi:hypothetical protein
MSVTESEKTVPLALVTTTLYVQVSTLVPSVFEYVAFVESCMGKPFNLH